METTASLPGRVVPYVDHAVPRYNGAFPKWREGRASGCWFPVCPETGEFQLGASHYDYKKNKAEKEGEEIPKKSHVSTVAYNCTVCHAAHSHATCYYYAM